MIKRKAARVIALATLMIGGAALSGCSAVGGSDDVVHLDFWAWGVGQAEQVQKWNEGHPGIQVRQTEVGGGDDSAAKLLAASRAGNAPDTALAEYTTLPSLIVADVPRDITKYVTDIDGAFTKGTWAQTTFGGVVYGIPQDAAPMVYTYRADEFAAAGQSAPTTWKDFASTAAAVHKKFPDTVAASVPASELGFYAGVAAQAGSNWWSVHDGEWTVGIADEKSLEVADFFEKLAAEGAVDTDPLLSPDWNKRVNEGSVAGWASGVWAPGVLSGVAPGTSGKWEMAPLPQWTPGDTAIPFQGGSAIIVTKNSDHPKEAAQFAKWMNASTAGNKSLLDDRNVYPASIVGQKLAVSNKPPALMPQQTDFYRDAASISKNVIPVTWGPNVNLAKSVFTDELNKAIANGTPWRDAFTATQDAVVADMKKVGYKVKTDD